MKKRSIIVFALACGWCAIARASPPDSLAGYSYFATYSHPLIPETTEVSVEFNADSTYIEHWTRSGITLYGSSSGIPGDYSVPGSGTYTYTKTSPTIATLILTTGTVNTWQLTYSSDGAGGLAFQGSGGAVGLTPISGSFVLQKLDPSTRPLANVATMLQVHSGESSTVGFVVSNRGDYLVRIAGPALAQFGVAHPWATPKFILYDSNGNKIPFTLPQANLNAIYSPPWDSAVGLAATNSRAFLAVGAFPYPAGSKDAAGVLSLAPGAYTLSVSADPTDAGGAALVEVYNYQ